MCRGDRREAIFGGEADREMFLATLAEMCGRTGILIHSYVLMSNHYHLLVETPEPNLVAGMQWFQGTYTQRFNGRHRLSGHLFHVRRQMGSRLNTLRRVRAHFESDLNREDRLIRTGALRLRGQTRRVINGSRSAPHGKRQLRFQPADRFQK